VILRCTLPQTVVGGGNSCDTRRMVPRNDAPAVFSEKGDRRPAFGLPAPKFENFGGIARPSRLALPEGRAGADRGPSPSIFLVRTPKLNPAECWDLMNRRTQPRHAKTPNENPKQRFQHDVLVIKLKIGWYMYPIILK